MTLFHVASEKNALTKVLTRQGAPDEDLEVDDEVLNLDAAESLVGETRDSRFIQLETQEETFKININLLINLIYVYHLSEFSQLKTDNSKIIIRMVHLENIIKFLMIHSIFKYDDDVC